MSKIRYVAIGASGAQGLQDITDLLAALPASVNAAVLVVLHRPAGARSLLRQILQRRTTLPVHVCRTGDLLVAGNVYLGTPTQHLTLCRNGTALLLRDPISRFRNRTVDLLFRSVALHAGRRSVGVVLAGSLDDGSRGLAAIHDARGITMVVEPSNSGTPGMPENALTLNQRIHTIGSVAQIASAIVAAATP